jgi:hypothetical protein
LLRARAIIDASDDAFADTGVPTFMRKLSGAPIIIDILMRSQPIPAPPHSEATDERKGSRMLNLTVSSSITNANSRRLRPLSRQALPRSWCNYKHGARQRRDHV